MKELILSTTAYKTFSGDKAHGRLSHAYMLYLNDTKNLKEALITFALCFFGFGGDSPEGRRILKGSFTDCRIYPDEGKKLSVENANEIIADSALQPLEYNAKLYIICGFEQASAVIQNKLLKILEEPPKGVYFILGVTSLAPVLDTVKSRVKMLTVPPFTEEEIFSALERKGENELNRDASKSCGGVLGAAENMISGGWFADVRDCAEKIACADTLEEAASLSVKYGDSKYKNEILGELSLLFSEALKERTAGCEYGKVAKTHLTPALIYAVESIDKAYADVRFNANFQGLLYDLMLRIIEENNRWLKLQA